MFDWMKHHEVLLAWAFAGSIVMLLGGIFGVPWLVVQMPADFFLRHDRPAPARHPVLRLLIVIGRNVIGWLLMLAGFAMLVLPGQGLLTILVAIALIDFPGKRRVELAIVRRGPIRRAIDWLRRRRGRPPIVLPDDPRDSPTDERSETGNLG